jgi:hypothetical protein
MSLNESHVEEAALECSFASLNPSPRPSPRGRGEARGHPAAESGHCTLATLRDTLLPKLLSGAAKELLK